MALLFSGPGENLNTESLAITKENAHLDLSE
eukprot:CAMPEP_0195526282 /NCGR_PEP_ID=MMETSP0794_2-20130614/27255_1 /TAXON_ID=515487 /ORGANISM="Stephanopyxis turris, Strain CCMP 815" /LENGTH=30 /DNA_ID= /DNA_START= /DNA_END= /DNA_ORIENTATION=